MQAKPVVDGIERDIGSAAKVVRLDLLSEVGAAIASRYGVEFTPTFLVFDARGTLVDASRRVDADRTVARLRQLATR